MRTLVLEYPVAVPARLVHTGGVGVECTTIGTLTYEATLRHRSQPLINERRHGLVGQMRLALSLGHWLERLAVCLGCAMRTCRRLLMIEPYAPGTLCRLKRAKPGSPQRRGAGSINCVYLSSACNVKTTATVLTLPAAIVHPQDLMSATRRTFHRATIILSPRGLICQHLVRSIDASKYCLGLSLSRIAVRMPHTGEATKGGIDVLLRGPSTNLEDFVVTVLPHGSD